MTRKEGEAPGPSTMEEGILPCLHCFSASVKGALHMHRNTDVVTAYVYCTVCKAQGPEVLFTVEGTVRGQDEALYTAKDLWNNSAGREALREAYPYFSRCTGEEDRRIFGHLPGYVWKPCVRCRIVKAIGVPDKLLCYTVLRAV